MGRPAPAPARSGAATRGCTTACVRSGVAPTLDGAVPPIDVQAATTGTLEGTRLMLRASALSLICAVLALTAAACGESGSGGCRRPGLAGPGERAALRGGRGPARRASGARTRSRRPARSCAPRIPAAKLRELIDEELAEEGDGLTWERDFASWLGEDAGVWAANLQADEPSFAVIVASKDAEAAKAALARFEKTAADQPSRRARYDGLDYRVDDEGMAYGIVGDFVVLGDRGRVQAHGRHARRRHASSTPTATSRPSASSRRTGSATTTSTSSRWSTRR